MKIIIPVIILALISVSVLGANPKAVKVSVQESSSSIRAGDEFTVYVTYKNNGGPAEKGWVAPSFPDSFKVLSAGSNNGLKAPIYRPGSKIGRVTAVDTTINSNGAWQAGEQKTLWVKVKAKKSGEQCYNVRASLKQGTYYSRMPTSGPKDQQGLYVEKRCINIQEAPKATVKVTMNPWDNLLMDGVSPPGAYFQYINGVRYLIIPSVSQVEHEFTVAPSKQDYESYSQIIDVNNNQFYMSMPSRMKTLLRVAAANGAQNTIYVDGEEFCNTWNHDVPNQGYRVVKNYCEESIAPGIHEVEIRLQGHERITKTVNAQQYRITWIEMDAPVVKEFPLKVVSDRAGVHVFTNAITVTVQHQGSTYTEDSCNTALDAEGEYSCILKGIKGYTGAPKKQTIYAKYPGYYDSHVDVDVDPDNGFSVTELELPMTNRIGAFIKVYTIPYSDVFFKALDGAEEDHCSSRHTGGEACTFGGQSIYGIHPREFKRGRYNVTIRPTEIYNPSSFVVDIQDNMTIDCRQHLGTERSTLTVNTNAAGTIAISQRELYRDGQGGVLERKIHIKTCNDATTCTASNLIDYSSGYIVEAKADGHKRFEESRRVDRDIVWNIELVEGEGDMAVEYEEPEEAGGGAQCGDGKCVAGASEQCVRQFDKLDLPLHPMKDFYIEDAWCRAEYSECLSPDHKGIDYLPFDTTQEHYVYAATRGIVRHVENNTYDNIADKKYEGNINACVAGESGYADYGNLVIMEVYLNTTRHTITYGHFKKGSVRVEKDQIVEAGEILGVLGSTGCSNWPHLHFEVETDEGKIDPYNIERGGADYPDIQNMDNECGANNLWKRCPPVSKAEWDAMTGDDGSW